MKTISDTKAAVLCKAWIEKAIKKGVMLRPGHYIGITYTDKGKVPSACALGSIEHALARGFDPERDWIGHEELARKADHGITIEQLTALENGFEGITQYKHKHAPLWSLGNELRTEAIKKLRVLNVGGW